MRSGLARSSYHLGAVALDAGGHPLAGQGQGHEQAAVGDAVALRADPLDLEFAQRHDAP